VGTGNSSRDGGDATVGGSGNSEDGQANRPASETAASSGDTTAQSWGASGDAHENLGKPDRRVRDPGIRAAWITGWFAIVAGILGALVAGVFTLVVPHLTSANGKPADASTAPAVSPHPVASACSPATSSGQQRRHGRLVLLGNGTAYDLDSCAQDWDPIGSGLWIEQNVAYAPHGDHGKPVLQIAQSPGPDVVMNGKGPWTYADCANAPYYADQSLTGPEVVTGAALDKGRGICVETEDVPKTSKGGPKTDGNHIALLVVLNRTITTLTLEVTVWQE
jgi:hypothetical protein